MKKLIFIATLALMGCKYATTPIIVEQVHSNSKTDNLYICHGSNNGFWDETITVKSSKHYNVGDTLIK